MENFLDFIKTYIIPFLDIAIVAFLFYTLYNVIAGTRAVQVLKGVLIIVLAYLLGSFLELNTFVWLFERGLEVAAFALVVIFQAEIRRIIMIVGENTPIGSFFSRKEREILQVIPPTCYSLSKKKIGALIAIVRKTGLRGFIEKGVRIDGLITKELLESIFIPQTPLHDGAVIIVEDRVAAAACLLPLTDRTDLEKIFGTRHRAAIGLTEETDAVVIVVSEENGHISIAHEGKLFYSLTPQKFEETLSRLLYKSKGDSTGATGRFKSFFKELQNKLTQYKNEDKSKKKPIKDSSKLKEKKTNA